MKVLGICTSGAVIKVAGRAAGVLDLPATYAKAVGRAAERVLVADQFHLVHLADDLLAYVR